MFLKTSLITTVMLVSYFFSFSQSGFSYDQEWKLMDFLMIKKNLPGSALLEVDKVYAAAKKDKNEAEWVKTIIYKNHLQETEDRYMNMSIKEMEEEISVAPPRVKALLKSIEADELFQYLQGHRYQLQNRTKITADTSTNMSAWTIADFETKIRSLYLLSGILRFCQDLR
jgi:hypothetical protein